MTKVSPNSKTETESDILLLAIVKSDFISLSMKKFLSISMTFKTETSLFFFFLTKVNPNNGNQIKIRDISMGHPKIWHNIFFWSKQFKLFQWLSKLKFLSFMTKKDRRNGNETKSENFPCGIFKSNSIHFFIKKYYTISITFKMKISHFYD